MALSRSTRANLYPINRKLINMKTQIETSQDCRVKLTLEFDSIDSNKAYSSVIRELSKEARIPGFMPGKVPKAIIEDRVGKQSIQVRAIERLAANHLPKVLSEHKFDLLSSPTLKNSNFDFDNILKLDFELELKPEVTLGQYEEVEVTIPDVSMGELTVDNLLNQLSKHFSPREEVLDSGVQLDDIITIDFTSKFVGVKTEDDEQKSLPEGQNAVILVGADGLKEDMREKLLGAMTGETRQIVTKFKEDYLNKDLAGRELEFTITVKKIERALNPLPIDDEFAVKAGRQNLDELKAALEKEIGESRQQEENRRTTLLLIDKILNQAQVQIPDWLVEREAKAYLQQQHDHEDGEECHHDHDKIGEPSAEDLKNAAKRLKLNFVFAAIAKQQNIGVSNSEVASFISWTNTMRRREGEPVMDMSKVSEQEVFSMAEFLLFHKIVKFLTDKAKVTKVEETEEALAEIERIQQSVVASVLNDF